MSKLEIDGRPQTMVNKDTLKHWIAIGSKNTEIAKIFNVGRNTLACCIKFHVFTDVLSKP